MDWGGISLTTPKLRGAISEVNAIQKADTASRLASSVILSQTDVQGELEPSRALMTSLDGKQRAITHEDLRLFRSHITAIERDAKKSVAGITPRNAISMSLSVDISRAKEQIKTAVVHNAKNGVLHFVTNAGPDSTVSRHHVHVQLLSYPAAAASGSKDPMKMARWLRAQPVRFDCDCGRHRFWYRYIASIGRWAYGRLETGYPKIRNPRLNGVCCKHVLRVMSELESSGYVLDVIRRMIEAGQNDPMGKASIKEKQSDADAAAKKQKSSSRAIKTETEREAERQRQRERRAAKKALDTAVTMRPKMAKKLTLSQESMLRTVMAANGQTEAMIEKTIKQMRGG